MCRGVDSFFAFFSERSCCFKNKDNHSGPDYQIHPSLLKIFSLYHIFSLHHKSPIILQCQRQRVIANSNSDNCKIQDLKLICSSTVNTPFVSPFCRSSSNQIRIVVLGNLYIYGIVFFVLLQVTCAL